MESSLEPLDFPGWITLRQAADLLGIERQSVGQLAMRRGWQRRLLMGTVIVLSEYEVMHYHRSRRRRPRTTPTDS